MTGQPVPETPVQSQPPGQWHSPSPQALAGPGRRHHAPGMFVVSEAEAAAIRAAFDRGGELSAAVELRRLFPGVTDNAQARECARAIAAWKPLPVKPRLVRLPGKRR
jgi:hypothetical protein